MKSSCCLFVYPPLINFWMPEPIFMILDMCIVAPEPISTASFINSSHYSVCLYVYPPIVARERLGKKCYRGNEHTRSNWGIIRLVIFCAVHDVSKESKQLVLHRTSSFSPTSGSSRIDCLGCESDMYMKQQLWWLSLCRVWYMWLLPILSCLACVKMETEAGSALDARCVIIKPSSRADMRWILYILISEIRLCFMSRGIL
jgi:hypothetical protein